VENIAPPNQKARPVQALPAKIFHWVNFVSLFLMLTSGLQIYNANPVFGGRAGLQFPPILLMGGWLAGGRHWHFASMWIFCLNLVWYAVFIVITQRWKHRFASSKDVKALVVSQNLKRKNYAWHRLLYTAILLVLALAVFTGIGMYKPAQFYWIAECFGGWEALRIMHFITVPIAVLFTILHSQLGRKVGGDRLINSMFWKDV
jgi:thiosulfate reductase cytochrome b subunit